MSYDPTIGRWLEADPAGYIDGPNLYQIESSNPVSLVDPTGLYDESGHFYTTYVVARLAGWDHDEAARLAYWSQYPDMAGVYDAIGALPPMVRPFWGSDIQNYIHSLTGAWSPNHRRCVLRCLLQRNDLQRWERGFLIHALGDSYAHSYFLFGHEFPYPPFVGHLFAGHAPDYISSAPNKYGSYVNDLYRLLNYGNGTGVGALADLGQEMPGITAGLRGSGAIIAAENNALLDFAQQQFGDIPPSFGPNNLGLDRSLQAPPLPFEVDQLMNLIKKGCSCCGD